MATDANFNSEEVFFQIISCISSGSEYAFNSQLIYDSLSQKSKQYTDTFLSSLKDIFTSDQYSPQYKFYSLYLLVKASESNNEFLMSRLARHKDILNYLFKTVQTDGKKPIQDRGFTYFSKNPSKEQSTIGHNYIVMLLEAFQYWYVAYGSPDANSPLHIFQTMFNSLSKMNFPESFSYVGKTYQLTEDFHTKPVESLSPPDNQQKSPKKEEPKPAAPVEEIKKEEPRNTAQKPAGKKEAPIEEVKKEEPKNVAQKPEANGNQPKIAHQDSPLVGMVNQLSPGKENAGSPEGDNYSPEGYNEAMTHLYECVYSGKDFERNQKLVLNSVNQNQADYNKSLLDGISGILESTDLPGTSKFYALLLLVRASETQNKTFMTQFAKEKKLLIKLAQDASYDNEKPEQEKGKTLFTKDMSSEDAVVGKNYLGLLLEAVQFWGKTYESADKNSAFARFKSLESSLAKVTKFPSDNVVIGKQINTSIMQNNKSFSKIDLRAQSPTSSKNTGKEERKPSEAPLHVEACVKSGDNYRKGVATVVNHLENPPKGYVEDYLNTVSNLLESKDTPPINKLYGLWLLVKTSERKSVQQLVEGLSRHEKILNRVFQGAQYDYDKPLEEKGVQMFPGFSVIGNKYVNVSLEALKFWAESHGTNDKSDPRFAFKYMYDSLKPKISFPKEYAYIGLPVDTDVMLVDTSQGQKPGKKGETVGVKDNKQGGKGKENSGYKEVEDGFRKLGEVKGGLKETLESNPKQDDGVEDFMEILFQEMNQIFQEDIEKNLEKVMAEPGSDEYVEKIFKEAETIEKLNTEYGRYKKGQENYNSFREHTLTLLGAKPAPVKVEQEKVNKPASELIKEPVAVIEKKVPSSNLGKGPMGPKIRDMEILGAGQERPSKPGGEKPAIGGDIGAQQLQQQRPQTGSMSKGPMGPKIKETEHLGVIERGNSLEPEMMSRLNSEAQRVMEEAGSGFRPQSPVKTGSPIKNMGGGTMGPKPSSSQFQVRPGAVEIGEDMMGSGLKDSMQKEEKKLKAGVMDEKLKVNQLPIIQEKSSEGKGELHSSDISHTIFSTSLVGRPGEEEKFAKGKNNLRNSAKPVEKEGDPNEKNLMESSPFLQRTTQSEYFQASNLLESRLHEKQEPSIKIKKPTIIGADARPLSNKAGTKPAGRQDDGVLIKAQPVISQTKEPQMWADMPTVNSKVLDDVAAPSKEVKKAKAYYEEAKIKWLSHYKFKAGDLMEDPEPSVETFRPEETSGHRERHEKHGKFFEEEEHVRPKEKVMEVVVRQAEVVKESEKRAAVTVAAAAAGNDVGRNSQRQQMRNSMVTSMRTSPSRNYDSELAGIDKGIKTSRVKAAELAKIGSSIKNSFSTSGKKAPNYPSLQDVEAKEEMEKELARLRAENSRLQRENNFLKSENSRSQGGDMDDKIALEEMKLLLEEYQSQISSLQNDVSYLKNENERLVEDLTLQNDASNARQSVSSLVGENKSLRMQIESLKHELSMSRGEGLPIRSNFSTDKSLSSKLLGVQPVLQAGPQQQLSKTFGPSQLNNINFSPRSEDFGDGNSTRNNSKQKAVKASHFMDVKGRTTETEKKGEVVNKSPGKKIFELPNYELANNVLEYEDNINRLKSPAASNTFSEAPRQSVEEVPKKQVMFANPQEEVPKKKIFNGAPLENASLQYEASQPRSSNARQENWPESPISMLKEMERQKNNEYVITVNNNKVKGDDSELDIREMISSRKDETAKEIRGKEVRGDSIVFARLKESIRKTMSSSDFLRFRMACLKNKCPLYENDTIQVGITSSVVHDQSGKRNLIKLVVYYGNKTKRQVSNFSVSVMSAKNINKLVKPERPESVVDAGKQAKQQIILSFKGTPFECLSVEAELDVGQQKAKFGLYLPSVITKFMEFKYVSAEEFREKWKGSAYSVFKSERIDLDPLIVRNMSDFKKYFGYLADLKPMDEYDYVQGKKGIKLGGVFELEETNVDYMLKINLLPEHKVVFQVACHEAKAETTMFLIQTLMFLFQKA